MAIHESYKWRSNSLGNERAISRLTRRTLLGGALSAPLGFSADRKPELSAFDLSLLEEGVTPNELFFVREHFPAPTVSMEGWKLSVAGLAVAPFQISLEDLRTQPRKQLPCTLECAENPSGGGMVSHAEWEGTPAAAFIDRAKPKPEAKFARLRGTDGFYRTIPLDKLRHADSLLVYRMNGQPLPPFHGGPLRLLLPGWYGMDSVKWLADIELTDSPSPPSEGYRRQSRSLLAGVANGDPVTAGLIKSVFSRPLDGAILTSRRFILRGVAWAGEQLVKSVEVSTDDGKTWAIAKLSAAPQRYCWTHWSFDWKILKPGDYKLAVRAASDQGQTQPAERPTGRVDECEQNHWQRIAISVR